MSAEESNQAASAGFIQDQRRGAYLQYVPGWGQWSLRPPRRFGGCGSMGSMNKADTVVVPLSVESYGFRRWFN